MVIERAEDLEETLPAPSVEVAFIEYNLGAPSSDQVIEYMRDIGFENKMSIGEHYEGEDVSQKDLLFINRKLDK